MRMLGTHIALDRAVRDLYRALPAVTKDLGFCGLIRIRQYALRPS